MDNIVCVLGNEFEYDFLSAWIKYNRTEAGISQEALSQSKSARYRREEKRRK